MQLNPTLIQKALKNVHLLPKHEQIELYEILDELERRNGQKVGQGDLLSFANSVYPGYKVGPHHRKLAKIFEEIAEGKKKRVIVNIAPRHGKSELISYLAPAWFIGKYPHKKVIMASHTADLAVNFGRRVRNLVNSDDYKSVFPEVTLQADSKSASRWGTNKQGEYFAIGVGGALAGRGADLFIIDDPHSEQEAKQLRPDVFLPAWEWFQSGPLQRLMPGGAIIIVMTRWSNFDLTGMIVDYMAKNPDADQWEIVEFPAILNDKPLWPEFWSIEELLTKKASMDVRYWNAQYMQQPTAEEGALIKREWWQIWDEDDPPPCEFIIQSWDTAFMKHNRADYSACTTWGVFYQEDAKDGKTRPHIILLDAFKDRMEFPELKEVAKQHYQQWNPDACVVEAKAAGTPLIFELRAIGIPVSEFTPSKGNDKIARVNAVTDLFASGIVWAPDTRWAKEVIEECAAFPAGMHDDFVDSCTQALLRFRKGGFVKLYSDYTDPPKERKRRRSGFY